MMKTPSSLKNSVWLRLITNGIRTKRTLLSTSHPRCLDHNGVLAEDVEVNVQCRCKITPMKMQGRTGSAQISVASGVKREEGCGHALLPFASMQLEPDVAQAALSISSVASRFYDINLIMPMQ